MIHRFASDRVDPPTAARLAPSYVSQVQGSAHAELGGLSQVELGAGQRVPEGVVGRRERQPVALPRPPQAQLPGADLAVAGEQALLELQGAHGGRQDRPLAHSPEGRVEEGQLERGVVGEEHASRQGTAQLGQHLRERSALLEVVVGQAMDGDRVAGVVMAYDVAPAPGEVDAQAVDRHPAHGQHLVAGRGEPGGLEVHGQQRQLVERGPVVGRHVSSRTG